jgi:hypothetical protein
MAIRRIYPSYVAISRQKSCPSRRFDQDSSKSTQIKCDGLGRYWFSVTIKELLMGEFSVRSAMFSGKRRLVTGLVAASLLATMVAETGKFPAAAKTVGNAAVANSVRIGPYGPACTNPSATTIKLLNSGAAKTYSIATLTACANYAVPSGSPTPSISPTARPSSSPSANPYPSPSWIPIPTANSISYAIGSNPAGVTAAISGDTLTVSTTVALESTRSHQG